MEKAITNVNSLTLSTDGLDEQLAALQPGDECYVRCRVKVTENDGGQLSGDVSECSYDGPCDGEESEQEDEGPEVEGDEMPKGEPMRRPEKGRHGMRPGGIVIMLGGK